MLRHRECNSSEDRNVGLVRYGLLTLIMSRDLPTVSVGRLMFRYSRNDSPEALNVVGKHSNARETHNVWEVIYG